MRYLFATALPVLVPALAAASDGAAVGTSVTVPSWLGVSGNLALLVAAIIAVGWLLRRQLAGPSLGANPIRILAAQNLGARDRLLVVEVADQQLLLGQTSHGIATLYVAKQPLIEAATDSAVTTSFADRLRSAMTGAGQ